MDLEEKLMIAMEKDGFEIDGTINWSSREFQRFKMKNSYKSGRPLFVILSGYSASYGDWRYPDRWKTVFEKSWKDMDLEEKVQREKDIQRLKHEKHLLTRHAVWRAQLLLDHQTHLGKTCREISYDHPYIFNKKIIPYYAFQMRSYLVLPIQDIDHKLVSLQFIKPNGYKQFKKNASPKDGMMWLSEPLKENYSGIIRLCEGYATGCTIHLCTKDPVVCAMSANNLISVAISLRRKFVHAQIIICADNDWCNAENVGVSCAIKAIAATGAKLCYPAFGHNFKVSKPSDFNDLFCLMGMDETKRQLNLLR
jgi:putative DNA primase/helicase